jgi:hypothetical protein
VTRCHHGTGRCWTNWAARCVPAVMSTERAGKGRAGRARQVIVRQEMTGEDV